MNVLITPPRISVYHIDSHFEKYINFCRIIQTTSTLTPHYKTCVMHRTSDSTYWRMSFHQVEEGSGRVWDSEDTNLYVITTRVYPHLTTAYKDYPIGDNNSPN